MVSILVLMDLSFLRNRNWNYKRNDSSVSILVLMDLSFLLIEFMIYSVLTVGVSILVLMDLSFLRIVPKTSWWNWKSFNPCSYGSFVLTYIFETLDGEQAKFQSLFLWIFRSYEATRKCIKSRKMRFNPCSYGSFVLTFPFSTLKVEMVSCFNPCSYGSFVLTDDIINQIAKFD